MRPILRLFLAAALFATVLPAANGDLDPAFWLDGTHSFNSSVGLTFGGAVAAPDGKLVVASSHPVAGEDQSSWRSVGNTTLGASCPILPERIQGVPADGIKVLGLALLGGGASASRLVVLSTSVWRDDFDPFFDRVEASLRAYAYPSCIRDRTFGESAGKTVLGVWMAGDLHGEPLQLRASTDGKLLVPGWAFTLESASAYALNVKRFTANGLRDTTFGAGGEVVIPELSESHGSAVTQAANGHIVVIAGRWSDDSGDFELVDITPDGSSWALASIAIASDSTWRATAIAATPDDGVIVAGSAISTPPGVNRKAAVARLSWDGAGNLEADPAFANQGRSIFNMRGCSRTSLADVVVKSASDGYRIVVGGIGVTANDGNEGMFIGQLLASGSFDPQFNPGGNGRRLVQFDAIRRGSDQGLRLAISGDRVYLAGRVASPLQRKQIGVAAFVDDTD